MNINYKTYLRKFSRFNQWEKEYEAKKTAEQKIAELMHLFELAMQMPPEKIERAHQVHLENLIEERNRLMEFKGKI